MNPHKPTTKKLTLLFFFAFVFTVVHLSAQDGKALFQQKCAVCHNIFKPMTGPELMNLEQRGPWADHNKLLEWIHNPAAFMAKDPYTAGLKAQYGIVMTPFPELTLKDVDAIVSYIDGEVAAKSAPKGPTTGTAVEEKTSGSGNAVFYGVISLILAVIALILMQVNSNLKKLSDDKEGIERPEPVPFYKNKIYIAIVAILLFILAGYYITKGGIGLGRTIGYEPVQPIFYSHKVHAGINQINCLYCHGGAWESKQASIPSVNVCMNCHKSINTYEKGPELFDADGKKIDGTAEIQKLYSYAGFDPNNASSWNPSKAKPIEWVKIHNLPDHVFFSHEQHVRAGKVQCQTCHGDITSMNEVKQFAELSMGWCINCHRETKVDFNYDSTKGNKFYSIYEKFHEDIKAGKMDSVTVKDIGGLECQKCHY
ncbi:MAG: c-type cytochrome [Chitinophagaceae bacterium]|jgi:cytochrome c551/c552|nr:c-type cytochrome [Chitinophagaceae bacterium]OQY92434.1 MAG: cytochrome C [Sphingobacteriales bacterium UTBCD1]